MSTFQVPEFTPYQIHVDLLKQLPDRAVQLLRRCGPGWKFNYQHDPVAAWPPEFWQLQAEYQYDPATPWVPCDWVAILDVAIHISGKDRPRISYQPEKGRKAWLLSFDKGTKVYGGDAHEAALLLLLAVCKETP